MAITTLLKICSKCQQAKPATPDYFYRAKKDKSGLQSYCKSCMSGYFKKYYQDNLERFKYDSSYYLENRERHRVKCRKWELANKEVASNYTRQRRARKREAQGNHTTEDVQRQYEAQKGKCHYCKVDVGDAYHVDHVIPLSRGGSNGPENIVIACPFCNCSKGNKMPHEWVRGGRWRRKAKVKQGELGL